MAVVRSDGDVLRTNRDDFFRGSAPFGVSLTLYNDVVRDYASIYRTQPNIRTVVGFLGWNVAQLPLRAIRRISESERVRLPSDHPLSQTLRVPNPVLNPPVTAFDWVDEIVEDLGIFGQYLGLKVQQNRGERLRVLRLPLEQTRIEASNTWTVDEYVVEGNSGRLRIPADAVIHLKLYNPKDRRVGLSRLETLRRNIAEDEAAGRYRAQLWRNAGRHSGIIERPAEAPDWSDDARDRFLADWEAQYSGDGPRAGGTPVLEDGMVWRDAAFTPKDAEYLGARRLSRDEAAALYQVDPVFVGGGQGEGSNSFASQREKHTALYQDTLGGWLELIEQGLDAQLVGDFLDVEDVELDFELEAKLRGSFEEQAKAIQSATGAPWMTRNEARAERGLPPVDGGDELIVPLNVTRGGIASPNDTAPPIDSGTASRSALDDDIVDAVVVEELAELAPARRALAAGRKDADELPSESETWADRHRSRLVAFFERQRSAVLGALGAGATLEAAWDRDRWETELRSDLAELGVDMTAAIATDVARELGSPGFDSDTLAAYVDETADAAAFRINESTRSQLAAADNAEDVGEARRAVFATAINSRAPQIALTRTADLGNFARTEGATYAGAGRKTWRVNAADSRHPHLNGETVPIGDTFSNGARWPADINLPVAERAGCHCTLEFTTEDS